MAKRKATLAGMEVEEVDESPLPFQEEQEKSEDVQEGDKANERERDEGPQWTSMSKASAIRQMKAKLGEVPNNDVRDKLATVGVEVSDSQISQTLTVGGSGGKKKKKMNKHFVIQQPTQSTLQR